MEIVGLCLIGTGRILRFFTSSFHIYSSFYCLFLFLCGNKCDLLLRFLIQVMTQNHTTSRHITSLLKMEICLVFVIFNYVRMWLESSDTHSVYVHISSFFIYLFNKFFQSLL